jgi:hypothetical protein
MVAKGISVLTARFAKAGYSWAQPNGFWLNSIFTKPIVAISMRLSCSDIDKWTGGRAWKLYNESSCLCRPFQESTCVFAHPTHSSALLYITFDIVHKLEFICTHKIIQWWKDLCVFLVNADRQELQLLKTSLGSVSLPWDGWANIG